jgi:membrane-bound serine protease (ClpP class)
MVLVGAIVLALFVVPSPWPVPIIIAALAWEVGQAVLGIRWSQRRRARVGAEALIGKEATVAAPCLPEGQVQVRGELWQARCPEGATRGDIVVVRGLDGLTLIVERAFHDQQTRA